MHEPGLEQAYSVNEEVAHREVEGQLLLLLPDDYSLYTLNESGKLVWQGLIGGKSLSEIASSVARHFDIAPWQAQADILPLLAELEAKGIIRRT